MKRIIKIPTSIVLQNRLQYIIKGDNKELSKILLNEQKKFCAYTEEYIGINDAVDIEHFNPNLKGKPEDGYVNWYSVKHKPNNIKRSTWKSPILNPSHEDFEKRIIYHEGLYICDPSDLEAQNLIDLLNFNEKVFVDERLRYINRRQQRIAERGISPEEYFVDRIENDIDQIKYLRAIQEVFKIDIWSMIPDVEEE